MSNDDALVPVMGEIEILGQKRKVNFVTRNTIAITQKFGISAKQFYDGLFDSKMENIVQAIWGATLIFEEFDIENPIEIKDELNIEQLFNLPILEMQRTGSYILNIIYGNAISQETIDEKKN